MIQLSLLLIYPFAETLAVSSKPMFTASPHFCQHVSILMTPDKNMACLDKETNLWFKITNLK